MRMSFISFAFQRTPTDAVGELSLFFLSINRAKREERSVEKFALSTGLLFVLKRFISNFSLNSSDCNKFVYVDHSILFGEYDRKAYVVFG